MKEIFFQILDMSVNASLLVLVVIAVRLVLKKAPKYIHCILWAMVALRLICPALPESEASLMPSNTPVSSMVHVETQSEPVTNELPLATLPQMPIEQVEEPEPQIQWMEILSVVWLAGVAVMAGYGVVSFLLLRRRVAPSVQQDGVWICDDVASPFILGVIRPRIYLPSALNEECRESVLAHEKAHLRRKDHWWKPLGFVLLAIHWFNPVMWLAYILLCRDIEAACDERVVKGMEPGDRKRYSEALLSCAMPRRSIAACPLAFGEQGIKGRIKSVLNYKKPTVWIILVAVVASGVLAVCLLTNPPEDQGGDEIVYSTPANSKKVVTTSLDDLKNKAPELFELNAENGFEIFVWEEQKTIWCGIMEHTDVPKTQEEVDELTAVSMRNMETILRQYRSTETNLHIIGRFESLEESGGEDIPPKAIEMWLKDQWGLGWFDMFSSGVLAFNDITGPGDRTYCATGETVDEDQLGLLLAEGVVTPSCLFEENMDRAKYDVYTIQGKDAAYLAAGLVCEDMVFDVYQLEKPAAEEETQSTDSTTHSEVADYNAPADPKKYNSSQIEVLKTMVPQYFGVSHTKGVEIFVWDEGGMLWCGLMLGTNRHKNQLEIDGLEGVPLSSMALILDTYEDIDDVALYVLGESEYWGTTSQYVYDGSLELWLKGQLGLLDVSIEQDISTGEKLMRIGIGSKVLTYRSTGEDASDYQTGFCLTDDAVFDRGFEPSGLPRWLEVGVYTIKGGGNTKLIALSEIYELIITTTYPA